MGEIASDTDAVWVLNAAQWMVAYFKRMKASLPESVREVLALFVDNFAPVGTTTFERFMEALEIFLDACIAFTSHRDRPAGQQVLGFQHRREGWSRAE